jgi:hypothetical protein
MALRNKFVSPLFKQRNTEVNSLAIRKSGLSFVARAASSVWRGRSASPWHSQKSLLGGGAPQIPGISEAPVPIKFGGALPQGNNCFATAAPPAARIAHLKAIARRRSGSSNSTALLWRPPYQRRHKTYRAARPVLQITTAPTAAMGVAIVQSGKDRVAVTIKTNAAHSAATAQAVR